MLPFYCFEKEDLDQDTITDSFYGNEAKHSIINILGTSIIIFKIT